MALAAALALEGAAFGAEGADSGGETAKRIAVGDAGFWQPGVLLQGWFLFDSYGEYHGKDSKGNEGTLDGINSSTFRIRRAELVVKGEIMKDFIFGVMIDPAKVSETKEIPLFGPNSKDPADTDTVAAKLPQGPISVFQDFWVGFKTEWADLAIGQFKIPVSWEGFNSSSKLLFPERAPVSKQFGDKRDLGFKAGKTFKYAGYIAGVWNGSDLNSLDTNNSKDFGLRFEAYPLRGLTVAGVVYFTIGERDDYENKNMKIKDRYEADLRYENHGLLFQAEYIKSNDGNTDKDKDTGDPIVKETGGDGFYVALAYTIAGKFQPAVRFGQLNVNTDKGWHELDLKKEKPMLRHIDAGINWFIQKHEAKLQFAYSRIVYEGEIDGAPVVPMDNQIIFAAQAAY
jgi:hypothetical protein